MRIMILCFLVLFLSISQANADVKAIRDDATILEKAARKGDIALCTRYSTKESAPYIERLMKNGLQQFIPKHITYGTISGTGKTRYLEALSHHNGQDEFIELAFTHQGKQWKFDLPESMRHGFGVDWQEQLQQIEQLYLLMKAAK